MSSSTADIATAFPYPGLRPFEPHEADIFFGRKQHVTDLLKRLRSHRFLAVVGPSGCGKSSLIRAGLIPALQAGFMASSRFQWNFAVMRPGNQPLLNLATALRDSGVFGEPDSDDVQEAAQLCEDLAEGSRSLADRLTVHELAQGCNLLILVDQFEELFRFERAGGADESRAFVNLLLETARDAGISAYVVITMRTDFLGQCPLLSGLPEAINESQYLTPRLSREQSETAIVGPARMFGGEIRPEVVTQILNDMGTDPDQLPLMQHLLMRMWCSARAAGNSDDDSSNTRKHVSPKDSSYEFSLSSLPHLQQSGLPSLQLTMTHYHEAGGLQNALSNHAERVFRKRLTTDRQRQLAEQMFRQLTDVAADGQLIRCSPPPTFEHLGRELSVRDKDELLHVIDEFRADGRSFLMPPETEKIRSETPIDISHESLIRRWPLLEKWTRDEAHATEVRRDITRDADQWERGKKRIGDAEIPESRLDAALAWSKSHSGTVTPIVREFLNACVRRRERQRRRDRNLFVVALIACVLMGTTVAVARFWRKAVTEQVKAVTAKAVMHIALADQFWFRAVNEFLEFRDANDAGGKEKGDFSEGLLWLAAAYEHAQTGQDSELSVDKKKLYEIRAGAVLAQQTMLQQLWLLEGSQPVAFSRDGKCVLGLRNDSRNELEVWQTTNSRAELLHELTCSRPIQSVAFSSDSQSIVATTLDDSNTEASSAKSELVIWSWSNSNRRDVPQQITNSALHLDGEVSAAGFVQVPDKPASLLATVKGRDGIGRVILWDSLSGAGRELFAETSNVKNEGSLEIRPAAPIASAAQLVISPAGRFAAVMDDKGGNLRIWDAAQNRLHAVEVLKYAESSIVAFSDDEAWLAIVSGGDVNIVGTTNRSVAAMRPLGIGVTKVAFGPDGRLLTVGADRIARMWTFIDPAQESRKRGTDRQQFLDFVEPEIRLPGGVEVQDVKFSPDGRLLAFGCRDRLLRVFDVQTGRLAFPPLHCPFAVRTVAFSADAKFVTGRTQFTIQEWRLATGNPPVTIIGNNLAVSRTWEPAVSADGSFMATIRRDVNDTPSQVGANEFVLNVRDLPRRETVYSVHLEGTGEWRCWGVSSDGRAALVDRDNSLMLAQRSAAGESSLFELDRKFVGEVVRAAFSPNGKWLVATFRSRSSSLESTADAIKEHWQLQLWALNPGTPITVAPKTIRASIVSSVAWSPNSDSILVGTSDPTGGTAQLWHLDASKGLTLENSLQHPRDDQPDNVPAGIQSVAFSNDGRFFVTGGADDHAFVWRTSDQQRVSKVLRHGSDVVAIHFGEQENGDLLFATAGAADKEVHIWVVAAADCEADLLPVRKAGTAACKAERSTGFFQFSPDGQLLATIEGRDVRIWTTSDGELAAVLNHEASVQSVRFADDSRSISTYGITAASQEWLQANVVVRTGTGSSPVGTGVQMFESSWKLWSELGDDGASRLNAFGQLLAASTLSTKLKRLERFDSESDESTESSYIAASGTFADLWSRYGDLLDKSSPVESLGHEKTAEACEVTGNWFAASWHRRKAIDAAGKDEKLIARQYAGLGRAFLEMHKKGDANIAWNKAVELDPEWSTEWRRIQIVPVRDAAQAFQDVADWQSAVAEWTKVIELSANTSPQVYYDRSEAYLRLAHWQESDADFRQALQLDVEVNRLFKWLERSESLGELKQWTAATESLLEVFRISPTSENGYSLAVAQLMTGDIAGYRNTCADLHYRFADCGDLNDSNNAVWASVLSAEGIDHALLKKAIVILQEGLTPTDAEFDDYLFLNTLGAAYYRDGNFIEAKRTLERARQAYVANSGASTAGLATDPVALRDQDGTVWDWLFLSMTCQQLGETEAALKWFEQAEKAVAAGAVTSWKQTAELQLLHKEARRLVMPETPDSPARIE